MTDERRGHSPTPRGGDDPLDGEIRRLLAVDPSPSFEARVRARVAAEPATNVWRAGRLWMACGAATAALVLAVAVFRPEPPADTGAGSGLGAVRSGGTAAPSPGAAAGRRDDPAAVSLPAGLVETSAAPEPAFPPPPGGVPRGPAGVETSAAPEPASPPPPGGVPRGLAGVETSAAPEPAFPRTLEAGLRVAAPAAAGESRGAGSPPAPAATPPGPPRFTRIVFSESETAALRRLLSQAPDRPVIVPLPVEARTPAVGEPRAEVVTPLIAIEPPAEVVIPPIAIEPQAEVVIPPIAVEPPLTIEPLNMALLDSGADQ